VELAKHLSRSRIGGDQAFFLGVSKAVLELDTVSRRGKGSESNDRRRARRRPGAGSVVPRRAHRRVPAWRAPVEATSWAQIVAWSGVDEDHDPKDRRAVRAGERRDRVLAMG